MYATANVGVRSAVIDVCAAEGRERMAALLRDADVFYANRRQGFLEKVGLSAQEAAALKPGIVHVTVSLHGPRRPLGRTCGLRSDSGLQ